MRRRVAHVSRGTVTRVAAFDTVVRENVTDRAEGAVGVDSAFYATDTIGGTVSAAHGGATLTVVVAGDADVPACIAGVGRGGAVLALGASGEATMRSGIAGGA